MNYPQARPFEDSPQCRSDTLHFPLPVVAFFWGAEHACSVFLQGEMINLLQNSPIAKSLHCNECVNPSGEAVAGLIPSGYRKADAREAVRRRRDASVPGRTNSPFARGSRPCPSPLTRLVKVGATRLCPPVRRFRIGKPSVFQGICLRFVGQ